MTARNVIAFVVALALPQIAGGIGALFTYEAIPSWYATLMRPLFAPPNWIFGPVWTTLFILMGIAAFIVWKKGWEKPAVQVALSTFGFQLVLNTFWSILFFGLQSPGLALFEIVLLWCAIAANIVAFWRVSRLAGLLLLPYIAWVSFAAYLNYMIWMLN